MTMTDKQIEQRCAWKSFEGTFCPEAQQQLDQLKAENERLKQAFAESDADCFRLEKENRLLKVYRSIAPFKVKMLVQTFTEIKPILEFYANSKIGEEQVDGTYKIMLSDGYVMAYDPKPARQALQKINEVDYV